jgi:hypothetical protein
LCVRASTRRIVATHNVDNLCRLGCASVRALIELARQALRFVYPRERGPQLVYIVFPTGALELSFGAAELCSSALQVTVRLAEIDTIEIDRRSVYSRRKTGDVPKGTC